MPTWLSPPGPCRNHVHGIARTPSRHVRASRAAPFTYRPGQPGQTAGQPLVDLAPGQACPGNSCATARPRRGRRVPSSASRLRQQAQVVLHASSRTRCRDRRPALSVARPAATSASTRSPGSRAPRATTSVVLGLVLHRARRTLHVHQHNTGPDSAATARHSGIVRHGRHIVDDVRPGLQRRSATAAFIVSTESTASGRAAKRLDHRHHPRQPLRRRHRRRRPGRVDSPPTSMMSAPVVQPSAGLRSTAAPVHPNSGRRRRRNRASR